MIITGEEEIVVELGEGDEVGEFSFAGTAGSLLVSFDTREGA